MKKCPRCGYEVKDDEKYCPHCGLDLQVRYRPIKPKNKSMTYLLYVIIFFSFITIPLLYGRILSDIGSSMNEIGDEKTKLPAIVDEEPTKILANYDTLADFKNQFSNVDGIVQSIADYEKTLFAIHDYTFDKDYKIQVLDNYNIYYDFTYTTKINEHVTLSIERYYDRAHQYNEEKIVFKKDNAQSFDELFLTDEQKALFETYSGPQTVTNQLMDDFAKRQDEFESCLLYTSFHSLDLTNTLGDYLSAQGLKQLRIAETEKYAHVTFFMDGGVDKEIEGATRVLINSPKVATYDLQPEMSAYEVKDALLAELDKDIHDVVIVNFANCDMVGHTGIIPAAIKAVSVVDECVGEVYEKVLELGGTMLITADHGNSERLLDEDDNPFTAHTTNPVPLILTNTHLELREDGKLGDLAPTILQLLGLPQPKEMTGESLLK